MIRICTVNSGWQQVNRMLVLLDVILLFYILSTVTRCSQLRLRCATVMYDDNYIILNSIPAPSRSFHAHLFFFIVLSCLNCWTQRPTLPPTIIDGIATPRMHLEALWKRKPLPNEDRRFLWGKICKVANIGMDMTLLSLCKRTNALWYINVQSSNLAPY